MKNLIALINRLFKAAILINHPSLRLAVRDVFNDKADNKPYVKITPIDRFIQHDYDLENIIEQEEILSKLDNDSIRYIFYAYGVLRASNCNNLYVLVELLNLECTVKVKNLKTLKVEVWTSNQFDKNYTLLDKQSLKLATGFFLACKNLDKQPDKEHRNCEINQLGGLRLVK